MQDEFTSWLGTRYPTEENGGRQYNVNSLLGVHTETRTDK